MTATDRKCPIDLLEHWARTHPQSVYLQQPEHRKIRNMAYGDKARTEKLDLHLIECPMFVLLITVVAITRKIMLTAIRSTSWIFYN